MVDSYPTSDGRPFAESDWHRNLLDKTISRLRKRYAADTHVYVSGNLLVYYEEGNKRKRVAPDVFVVKGAEKRMRRYYLTWEEKHDLNVVIEATSAKTRREDTTKKFEIYRDVLKVRELFYFDLFAEYLNPRLQGHRLKDGRYVPIPAQDGRLFSEVLGLWLEPVGLDLPLAESLVTDETGRDARIEKDVLEMLRIIRELRREHEKITWRKE
jgi:Uma2 family endonuclease